MAEEKRGRGRPPGAGSKYSIALADRIIERLSEGTALRQICRDEKINWRTIYLWIDTKPDFAAKMRQARELGMAAIAEECLEIANTPLEGVETEQSENGLKIKRSDMLGHRKLQIETRLKLLACWDPKRYGNKITHAGDPEAPITLVLNGSDVEG